uniref:Zinc finger GRF-type domain-containing protein n=1 Tax=Setaria viridis TaxID=4556 RepID=A0A4U6U5U2_SETVI|nr:hypothetical protein SEVIR_6G157200v2 [Setaria viridis]
MSSWRDDQHGIPPWNERPKCHCGFRAWLQVWDDRLPRGKKGCRYFKYPDIDDDFKACTFMEWIDTRSLEEVGIILHQLETKGQYYARHTETREAARLAWLEQERCIHQQQIRAQEVALKRQEEKFKARQAQLLQEEEQHENMKKQDGECSSKKARTGKLPQFT